MLANSRCWASSQTPGSLALGSTKALCIFTDNPVRQQLDTVLTVARRQGEVRVKTQDGKEYSVRPVADSRSPFDIAGVDLNLA